MCKIISLDFFIPTNTFCIVPRYIYRYYMWVIFYLIMCLMNYCPEVEIIRQIRGTETDKKHILETQICFLFPILLLFQKTTNTSDYILPLQESNFVRHQGYNLLVCFYSSRHCMSHLSKAKFHQNNYQTPQEMKKPYSKGFSSQSDNGLLYLFTYCLLVQQLQLNSKDKRRKTKGVKDLQTAIY